MISKIKTIRGTLAALLVAASVAFVPAVTVSAACDTSGGITSGVDCAGDGVDNSDATLFGGSDSIFTIIVNTLLFVIGAISVIMLIYGGIRYTTSGGVSSHVTAAKNTIMYAIIGLVVAFLAFAVVNWVLGSLGTA